MNEQEKLEKYLEGEMSESEKIAFEKKMKADPELTEQVRLHQALEVALGNREEIAVEANLQAIMAEKPAQEVPNEKKVRRLWQYLSVAAAVVILLVGVKYIFFNDTITPDQIYTMHYVAYDGSGELRTGDSVPRRLLDNAFDSYNAGNYAQALNVFDSILVRVPGNARANFYLGICFMETGQSQKAIEAFQAVLDHGQNLYINQSTWYIAMACLNLKDLACTRSRLESLAGQTGAYGKKAKEILEILPKQ